MTANHRGFKGDVYHDEHTIFIKTIQFYNHNLELEKEILIEQVSCDLNQPIIPEIEVEAAREQSHNTSTIQYGNSLFYFKRIFDHKSTAHKL